MTAEVEQPTREESEAEAATPKEEEASTPSAEEPKAKKRRWFGRKSDDS
jgi:nucleoid-associated protein YgaU